MQKTGRPQGRHAARESLVQLRSPSGEVLMIGLGGDKNVLDHIAASGWPAQHSVGDPEAEGTIAFMMGSYDSEMPKAYAIPNTLARRAIDHFFRTGTLLADVRWDED